MWANAQRDGRPAEYGRHPLFNAAKFAATSHTASELDSVMEFGLKPTKATGTAYTSVYLRTRCASYTNTVYGLYNYSRHLRFHFRVKISLDHLTALSVFCNLMLVFLFSISRRLGG